ncbi:hypothetical protein E4T70_05550 [Lactobacillus johnsonii]|jgi:hypothetical protein|uniref:hypothetical protein n=1 Tax=Lactobacillus johnsonii TaxID=33959 RepID=UPI001071CE49|nr:hypothetical protein [Lactobacillus johnsonii]MBF0771691.1 hypothetical protein [Lactobacillus johnsonii]MCF1583271.1 hypothetical protein [Lactobacillus johnsonii]MCI9451696.1 hypothetical protein [Lactobacillus johnsonii]MDG4989075.1 hypothetical protein [Lactobacillus johnsonii]NDO44160.1 hypothetical protein [Lactobacillus johnsonii]
MKDVVFNEVVSGRRIMVFKHTKPWTYYTGYIQLYPLDDPAEWIAQVNNRNEDYFDRLDEFSNFPYGVTYAGNLSIDGEWWVGFDTASAPSGEIDKEECIDALKATALTLKIRAKAVKDAVANLKDKKDKATEKPKNVGLLLETLTDIAKANTANKFDEKDNAERYLNEAGNNVAGYLIKELGVNPADIALYAIAKIVLNEDEED